MVSVSGASQEQSPTLTPARSRAAVQGRKQNRVPRPAALSLTKERKRLERGRWCLVGFAFGRSISCAKSKNIRAFKHQGFSMHGTHFIRP